MSEVRGGQRTKYDTRTMRPRTAHRCNNALPSPDVLSKPLHRRQSEYSESRLSTRSLPRVMRNGQRVSESGRRVPCNIRPRPRPSSRPAFPGLCSSARKAHGSWQKWAPAGTDLRTVHARRTRAARPSRASDSVRGAAETAASASGAKRGCCCLPPPQASAQSGRRLRFTGRISLLAQDLGAGFRMRHHRKTWCRGASVTSPRYIRICTKRASGGGGVTRWSQELSCLRTQDRLPSIWICM
ncbi:hypothetical protein K466DRAFT_223568 [Polyporus arcularius HHB13444]|uniref:Uncharacterized protein n=1 Tax=Polyporus arcularius HHB13444 TaxID=1314778 RepID=A0A5C3PV12_9APHY|nr:hypothetical protein K466DRAFT_223568 [Polyporus arcularius HHB13444]